MTEKQELHSMLKDYFDFNIRMGTFMRDKFNINGKGEFELSSRQFQILLALTNLDNISALEEFFNISKSSLSLTISKMETAGLVYKEHVPKEKDKRIVRIRLTEKGEEKANKFLNILAQSFYEFCSSLNEEQLEHLKIGITHFKKIFT